MPCSKLKLSFMLLLLLKRNLALSLTSVSSTILKGTCSFSSASATQNPAPKSNFIRNYLITSFGFSPQKTVTASKLISHLTSAEKPDSVRHFLKHHAGLTDPQIRAIVSSDFRILCTSVDRTLEPNLRALRGTGYFSDPELRKLIVYHPRILTHTRAIPRLEFWRSFLYGDTKKLLYVFIRNPGLICQDIDTGIASKISLLKRYGLSQTDIGMVLHRGPGVFRRSIPLMEALLKRVQELGFPRGSLLFVHGLVSLSCVRLDMFKAKMEVFKSFGWSERDFLGALRKYPHLICLSMENIQEKMEFLVGRAGCELTDIASHPMLLTFSLEKRLMPRHHVMNILMSSKLVELEMSFYTVMKLSEKHFVERIILRNMAQVPELHDNYTAAIRSQYEERGLFT